MKLIKKISLIGALTLPALAWSQQFYIGHGTGTDSPGVGDLVRIDSSDCSMTTVGPIGFSVTGLAQNTEGNLYASESTSFNDSRLIRINKANGAGVAVGSIDPIDNGISVPDIMFNNNVLYGWSEDFDGVISIDTVTGAETVIGGGRNSAGSGFATTPDGTAYVVPCGACGSSAGEDDSDLFTVNLADGTLTYVIDLVDNTTGGNLFGNGTTINSMTADANGNLWALSGALASGLDNELVTIDIGTGSVDTVCTGLPIEADSLSYIDEADDLIFYDGFGLLPFIM